MWKIPADVHKAEKESKLHGLLMEKYSFFHTQKQSYKPCKKMNDQKVQPKDLMNTTKS